MKRILSFAAVSAILLISLSSCTFVRINKGVFEGTSSDLVVASKDTKTVSYALEQFTGIETSVAADIVYKMGEGEPSIKIEAPENFIDRIKYEVEDGILKISFDGRQSRGKVLITAQSSTLTRLNIRGSGDFDAPYGIVSPFMDIDIQGAGDINLKGLECLEDVSVVLRGAGDIDISDLSCQNVKVEVLGAGDVDLDGVAESADLSIKGAGDIDIAGLSVADVTTSVQGVGSIRRK